MATIHASKGLEYDAVIVCGAGSAQMPHPKSTDPEAFEEERRLMYVAVTRARQRLYLTLAQSRMLHGQTRYAIKSRFFDEIPEPLLKWLTPRVQAFQAPNRVYGTNAEAYQSESVLAASHRTPPQKSRDLSGFRIGQLVRHARFGEGVIVAAQGSGEDAKIQINFGAGVGMKLLMLSMAKLEPV